MKKIKAGLLVAAAVVLAAVLTVAPVSAGDDFLQLKQKPSAFTFELGARYWYGWAKTSKDLFDPSNSFLVSRLTYGGLKTHTGEVFGRLDHTSGIFLKGMVGAGSIAGGNLNDEDFPPVISPYSSTSSDQKNGGPAFVNLDAGINLVKGGDFRIGAFVGYHYLGEKVSAYGCSQIATNPAVCAGTIPSSVLVITQNNNWHALRLGLDAELALFDRMKLNLDAAWLPIVRLNGQDFHWLRIGSGFGDFTGSLPEDGNGRGYQLEAVLSYKVTDTIDVGVGGRYWHMQTAGNTHFENHVVGFTASPQPVDWKADHYGIFLQANFRFGPYPAGIN